MKKLFLPLVLILSLLSSCQNTAEKASGTAASDATEVAKNEQSAK